jgi:hypothetical protein
MIIAYIFKYCSEIWKLQKKLNFPYISWLAAIYTPTPAFKGGQLLTKKFMLQGYFIWIHHFANFMVAMMTLFVITYYH